ncbi:hypothetical protein AX17_001532 [Amanita inopinata Kibby_2008]|nr:hypothetical protein AX17_001532 [Amanita inopinata Kibby_2008]
MGKLNIAHHKSYHPYRRDNIERVRRDEEEARLKEAKEEGRIMLADSEARIDLLRHRAGGDREKGKKSRRKDEMEDELEMLEGRGEGKAGRIKNANELVQVTAALPTTDGHINFFHDLEQSTIAAAIKATKKVVPAATDKGIPLAPSEKDLKPWYSERDSEKHGDEDVESKKDGLNQKRMRDTARKSIHDPLTSINQKLSSLSASTSTSNDDRFKQPHPPSSSRHPAPQNANKPPEVQARLTRESSERERALALIRRKKREMMGSETPSTVHGGLDDEGAGYGDVFNRKEVEEAHRERERDRRRERERGPVHWGDDSWGGRNRSSSRRW